MRLEDFLCVLWILWILWISIDIVEWHDVRIHVTAKDDEGGVVASGECWVDADNGVGCDGSVHDVLLMVLVVVVVAVEQRGGDRQTL